LRFIKTLTFVLTALRIPLTKDRVPQASLLRPGMDNRIALIAGIGESVACVNVPTAS